ncbi:MAG: ABC transporter substrate-binding protein [Nocardioides sp.]|nr:ABC transporter substrate-binding protein [Nocardioides sp.]
MTELEPLTRLQGATRALIAHELQPAGWRLSFADEPVLAQGFRKMVRSLEYDVAELALTTYLTAKEHGAPFTALPIPLVRDFHHGATQVLAGGPIRIAADLTGRRVGVNRGYTVTTGVWGRAELASAGLDLSTVTWVRSGDEHVATYAPPANVEQAPAGAGLEELLLAGELAAVVGAGLDHPDVVPLLTSSPAWEQRRIFPINHLVVIRDDLVAEHPGLATAVFDAFVAAKQTYLDQLRHGLDESEQDRTLRRVMETTRADPLPYGLEPNRAVLEELVRHAVAQGILTRAIDPADVFVGETLQLVG